MEFGLSSLPKEQPGGYAGVNPKGQRSSGSVTTNLIILGCGASGNAAFPTVFKRSYVQKGALSF
jgi:hypothetical protein